MTQATHHPIRDAEIRIFGQIDGPDFIGRFWPYDTYPILFIGKSADDVRGKMDAFVVETVAKNEAAFISRAAAIQKAREARKAKAAA